ncbi:hypothetical protein ACN47E_001387 [Coniothyrium glycines]
MPPTEYAARQPLTEKGEAPVAVLVTGFGPFLAKFPINSSWEIASNLPALIPVTSLNKTPIHIRVHHEAIRVAYKSVVDLVPTLLPPQNPAYQPPDIILHIGLAAGRSFFAIENGSSRDVYDKIPDVDGERFSQEATAAKFPKEKFPSFLTTSFNTSDVLARWKAQLGFSSPDGDAVIEGCPDVRISQDAGNFMCGFIYYNSLAHYFSIKEGEKPVVFLHVPDLSGSADKLREGREVTIALIKALVESRRELGVVDTPENTETGKKTDGALQTDNNFS